MAVSGDSWMLCGRILATLRQRSPETALAAARALAQAAPEQELELLALSLRSTPGDPSPGHALNCGILAVAVGRAMDWSDDERAALAALAFVQDQARARALPAGLSPEELDAKLHPPEPRALFDLAREIEEAMPADIAQMLDARRRSAELGERGLARQPRHPAAEIVALCDLYEVGTHPRSWRACQPAQQVLLALLRSLRRSADADILKAFGERITLFPPGTLVELSSGEFAVVEAPNPRQPSQPVVLVRAGVDGSSISPPRRVDLSRQPLTSIRRALAIGEALSTDAMLNVELTAAVWWPSSPKGF